MKRQTFRQAAFMAMLLAIAIAGAFFATPSQAQNVSVQGLIVSRSNNTPVPGMTVFLLHPVLGRSAPSITDEHGRFGWSSIPVRSESYFLEAYWGATLMYRQPLPIRSAVLIPTIRM
jgi:hypothetical protein